MKPMTKSLLFEIFRTGAEQLHKDWCEQNPENGCIIVLVTKGKVAGIASAGNGTHREAIAKTAEQCANNIVLRKCTSEGKIYVKIAPKEGA